MAVKKGGIDLSSLTKEQILEAAERIAQEDGNADFGVEIARKTKTAADKKLVDIIDAAITKAGYDPDLAANKYIKYVDQRVPAEPLEILKDRLYVNGLYNKDATADAQYWNRIKKDSTDGKRFDPTPKWLRILLVECDEGKEKADKRDLVQTLILEKFGLHNKP
jgi:hypothetical protein